MADKRCFLQWFVLALTFATGTFFAWHYGLLEMVWQGDVTHMTTVIAGFFVTTCAYLGLASWRYDRGDWTGGFPVGRAVRIALADTNLARTAAFLVTLIGLLGTAIGLMFQVRAMGSIDVSNPQNIVAFIQVIGSSMATALYATSCGIIACIGISLMNANLEYFIDRDGGGGMTTNDLIASMDNPATALYCAIFWVMGIATGWLMAKQRWG